MVLLLYLVVDKVLPPNGTVRVDVVVVECFRAGNLVVVVEGVAIVVVVVRVVVVGVGVVVGYVVVVVAVFTRWFFCGMDTSVVRCLGSVVSAVVRVMDFPPLGLALFDPSASTDAVTKSDGIT